MTRGERVFVLDALRVLGVALVVFVHYLQHFYLPLGGVFGIPGFYEVTLGGVGVTLLLVVSGAGLELSSAKRARAWRHYVERRLVRIYPTYWLSVALALVFLGRPGHGLSPSTWALDLSGFLTFTNRPWADYALPTGWFIGLIVALYLLFPIVSDAMRRRPALALGVLFVVSVGARVLVGRMLPDGRALDWFPLCRIFEFGLGVWCAATPSRREWLTRCCASASARLRSSVAILAAVSYPVFLIHYIPLNAPAFETDSAAGFVLVTLAVTTAMSLVVFGADRVVQRAWRSWRPVVAGRGRRGAVR